MHVGGVGVGSRGSGRLFLQGRLGKSLARGVLWSQVSYQKKVFWPLFVSTKVMFSSVGSWGWMAFVRKEGLGQEALCGRLQRCY